MSASELNSRNFRVEKFRHFVNEWSEETRLDFKERMYQYGGDENQQLDFTKDVIAFANIARRTGQPCYIVFGVKRNTREIVSVHGQYPVLVKPSAEIAVKDEMTDFVLEPLRKTAENWVAPYAPQMRLEHGEYENRFVAWLEIDPNTADASTPFSLKKSLGSFHKGDVFLRFGSSNVKVDSQEARNLLRISEADYLQRKQWQSLVEHHRREGSEARTFWMLPDYIEIKTSDAGASAEQTVLQLLAEGKQQIHVTAPAGVGKTVLLQRLAYALARRHSERVTETDYFGQSDPDTSPPDVIDRVDLLEVVPTQPVAIYMTLRATYDSIDAFTRDFVTRVKEMLGNPSVRSPETLFAIPNSKWVLLLDGVDELGNREEFGDKLQVWIRQLPPNVQVVLSARPYAAHPATADAHVALATLDRHEIHQRLELEQLPAEDLAKVQGFLEEQPDLYTLFSRHRMLNGLLESARRGIAADAQSPVRSDIDQPKVEVQEVISPTLSSGESGAVPVLSADVGPTPGAVVNDDSDDEAPPLPLELTDLLEGMVSEMQEQEVERRNRLGNSANDLAQESLTDLQYVGWEVAWDRDDFDSYRAQRNGWWKRETRLWNEEIGFVNALPDGQAQFVCGLFHCYLAAKHGDRESDDVVLERAAAQTYKPERAELVLRLLLELRARRGAQVSI
jgi:hypothetical protein